MARGNFNACLTETLGHEGGYVDNPRDPGGATNMGITHRTLAAYRGVKRLTKKAVRALTRREARKIAREEGSISLEIAGRPSARAEAPLTVSGVRSGADGAWTIERVEHSYDPASAGYTTSIEAKKGNA